MIRPPMLIWLLASTGAVAACVDDGRGSGLDDEPITVSAEQEQAMCEHLTSSSSTGQLPKSAGATIGEGGAVDAAAGLKTIELTDFEGQYGGYVRLSINPDNNSAVFLMLAEDVPFAPVREDGTEVVQLAAGDAVCDDAAGRFLWVVSESENYLRFGPTAIDEIKIVIETVE